MKKEKGFLLLEVLIAILIVSVSFSACLACLGQILRLAKISKERLQLVLGMENLFFELEAGEHPEMTHFGGKGGSRGEFDYQFEIETESQDSKQERKEKLSLTHFNLLRAEFKGRTENFETEIYFPDVIL